MLQKLPRDILLVILEQVQIPSRTDLKQLCEVSKRLYNAAIRKLYENIVIRAKDDWHLERVDVEPFLRTRFNPTSPLDHDFMWEYPNPKDSQGRWETGVFWAFGGGGAAKVEGFGGIVLVDNGDEKEFVCFCGSGCRLARSRDGLEGGEGSKGGRGTACFAEVEFSLSVGGVKVDDDRLTAGDGCATATTLTNNSI
ncbi:hypothetical protein B0O99DRAFT_602607 [Bisporella sp. PMI_857]|nr:hypothetical protein B0O99DRAFT_602607 [Bisporella sp. PMI_857]